MQHSNQIYRICINKRKDFLSPDQKYFSENIDCFVGLGVASCVDYEC